MRILLLTSMACGTGGLGRSEGSVTYTDAQTGEVRTVLFDGGALAWSYEGVHTVATTDWGRGYDCEYAQVHLVRLSGRDLERDSNHHDLLWNAGFPDRATLLRTTLQPDPVTVAQPNLTAEMQFDDDPMLSGVLSTEGGAVTFDAYDCGAL